MTGNTTAFVGLGSNLGDRVARCVEALGRLQAAAGRVAGCSPLYETAPVQVAGGWFVNAAVRVETGLDAPALLAALQAIEAAMGRPPDHPAGAPRAIDLDLLLYGESILRGAALTVPHPRMHQRRFVLEPLAALAPDLRHPVLEVSVRELLRQLRDPHPVRRLGPA